jgi:hypothetical protein
MVIDHQPNNLPPSAMMPPPQHPRSSDTFSPTYEPPFAGASHSVTNQHVPVVAHPQHPQRHPAPGHPPPDADQIWQGFEMTAQEQLPVWISDQSLGGNSFSQHGMDAFLLPTNYLPPAPQIW